MAEDVVTVAGLPVTSPTRTLFDVGGEVGPTRFRYLLNQFTSAGGSEAREQFLACFDALAHRGVPGVQMMRSLLLTEVVGPGIDLNTFETMVSLGLAEHLPSKQW